MAIPATHIKLGATAGTLRPYMLDDPRNITQMLANPVAAKLGTGGSKYDDFNNWAYWVQEDWSAGAGRRADSPGLLYGDLSTFMAARLTLPMLLRPT